MLFAFQDKKTLQEEVKGVWFSCNKQAGHINTLSNRKYVIKAFSPLKGSEHFWLTSHQRKILSGDKLSIGVIEFVCQGMGVPHLRSILAAIGSSSPTPTTPILWKG